MDIEKFDPLKDAVQQNASAAPPAETPARKIKPGWLAIAILVVVILAESVLLFRINSPEHERNDVLAVSRKFLVLLTTYDAASLATQRTQVLALATGRFRSDFDRLSGAPTFINAVKKSKATSVGTVKLVGVTTLAGDNAGVLALVDVTRTNKDNPTPSLEPTVIEVSLVHTSSGWRIDGVTVDGAISKG
jgi:hypothetical protein